MSCTLRKITKILLIALILGNIAFIFVQSMLPPAVSSEESNTIGEIIEEIIPPDTEAGEFVHNNLRKIAHFVEFATLGVWVSAYIILFVKRPGAAVLSLPSALAVAFLDETVQIFSGRGPSVVDVWIDFSGFLFSAVICYTASILFYIIRKNVNKNRHNQTEK